MGVNAGSASRGVWPTPDVASGQRDMSTVDPEDQKDPVLKVSIGLADRVRMWPTPTASLMNDSEDPAQWQRRKEFHASKEDNPTRASMPLTIAARMWATPTVGDAEASGSRNRPGSDANAGLSLTDMVRGDGGMGRWPTPTSTDGGANSLRDSRGNVGANLKEKVQAWPTPSARDHKGSDLPSRSGGASLAHAAQTGVFSHSSPPGPTTNDGPPSSPSTPTSPLRLNPLFSAWLMGWRSTWTIAVPHASSAQATASWRWQQQQQLSSLFGEH